MSKGFIFSIDALFAVLIIIAASIAFLFLVQKTDSELFEVQMLRITADDSAMVSFYLGQNSTETADAFLPSKNTGYCARSFQYVVSDDRVKLPEIATNDFCEGS